MELCLKYDEKILSDLDILVAEIEAVCPGSFGKNSLSPFPEDEEMLKEDPFLKGDQQSTDLPAPQPKHSSHSD
jgi:hypothetical protein